MYLKAPCVFASIKNFFRICHRQLHNLQLSTNPNKALDKCCYTGLLIIIGHRSKSVRRECVGLALMIAVIMYSEF